MGLHVLRQRLTAELFDQEEMGRQFELALVRQSDMIKQQAEQHALKILCSMLVAFFEQQHPGVGVRASASEDGYLTVQIGDDEPIKFYPYEPGEVLMDNAVPNKLN